MEVPMINRITDFEVGINSINDPSFLSRVVSISGIGKLHLAYGFWQWGALIIAVLAYFTNFVTRIKVLVDRLRKIDVSISSPDIYDEFDSESDDSLDSSDDDEKDEEEDEEDEKDVDSIYNRVNGGSGQGQSGNFACFSGSFGDLFTWPDLTGIGSSGVVKFWDNLDLNGEEEEDDGVNDNKRNVVSSFIRNVSSSSLPFFLTAENKGSDGVKVEACDPRAGFRMPALLAEWRQPGKLLGNIIGVDFGDVEKIYVSDDVNGKIAVGDLRRFNGALTESYAEAW